MFDQLLAKSRKDLVAAWRRQILETYPEDTARFIKSEPNQFANPVGNAVNQGVEAVFDALLSGADGLGASADGLGASADGKSSGGSETLLAALDDLIRIRSVQNFRPAEAVGIVFLLKKVVREKLEKEIGDNDLYREQLLFEDRVDRMALLAFETYMRCREDLFAIKTRALKNGPFKLHERSKKILDKRKSERTDHKDNGSSS